jgi:hypothetical protein
MLESALKQKIDGGVLIDAIEPNLAALAAAIQALPQENRLWEQLNPSIRFLWYRC